MSGLMSGRGKGARINASPRLSSTLLNRPENEAAQSHRHDRCYQARSAAGVRAGWISRAHSAARAIATSDRAYWRMLFKMYGWGRAANQRRLSEPFDRSVEWLGESIGLLLFHFASPTLPA
jgi:hypothetical protein